MISKSFLIYIQFIQQKDEIFKTDELDFLFSETLLSLVTDDNIMIGHLRKAQSLTRTDGVRFKVQIVQH